MTLDPREATLVMATMGEYNDRYLSDEAMNMLGLQRVFEEHHRPASHSNLARGVSFPLDDV